MFATGDTFKACEVIEGMGTTLDDIFCMDSNGHGFWELRLTP